MPAAGGVTSAPQRLMRTANTLAAPLCSMHVPAGAALC
jgi:hypothetical protein